MKKKLVMISIVLALGLNLCACGKKEVDNNIFDSQTTTESVESAEITEETKSTESTGSSTSTRETKESAPKESTAASASKDNSKKSNEASKENNAKSSSLASVEANTGGNTSGGSGSTGRNTSGGSGSTGGNTSGGSGSNGGNASGGSGSNGGNASGGSGSNGGNASGGSGSNGGNTPEPTKPAHTSHTWDSGKVTAAASCTVCGETKTENIGKTAHNYVTETTPATCTAAGKEKVYCSVCGNVQSEKASGSPTGHDLYQEVWYEATCTSNGYYNNICKNCDFVEGVSVPPLDHDVEDKVIQEGSCTTARIVSHICRNCGNAIGPDDFYTTDDHNWATAEEFGETYEYCTNCGNRK